MSLPRTREQLETRFIELMLRQHADDNVSNHDAWLRDKAEQTRLINGVAAELGAPASFVRRIYRRVLRRRATLFSGCTDYLDLEEFQQLITDRVMDAARATWRP